MSLNRLTPDTLYSPPRKSMTSVSTTEPQSLFRMARSKLQSAIGSGVKDTCSLYRWVLLKNSMTHSTPSDAAAASSDKADVTCVYRPDVDQGREEDDEDAFMFPDPGEADAANPEQAWVNSLLESLGDEDDDLVEEGTVSVTACPVDDDDEPLSPLCSPMSSSDDLVSHSSYYCNPHAIPFPYPIPYPPLRDSPLSPWLEGESSRDSLIDARPPLYHDPLPYYNVDDTEDLPVPDAIEDTSDDESDAPCTPFEQSTSSLSPVDPAFIPLPPERRVHSLQPQVYIDTDDSYFYPFELDPVPPHDANAVDPARAFHPSVYQEC